MDSVELEIATGAQPSITNITDEATAFCAGKGEGLLSVFVPHATAGLAIIETGAGSDLDVLAAVGELLPAEPSKWRHQHGTPGHGRDHVVPAFISPSLTIPVQHGRMTLGTWQSIVLVDTNADNHHRKVRLSFLSG